MNYRTLKQAVRVIESEGQLDFRLFDARHSMPSSPMSASRASSIREGRIPDEDSEFVTWLAERGLLEATREPSPLAARFIERHDRTLRYLASFEHDDLTALDMLLNLYQSRVLVIGIGGVGSWITYSLMMSGIGTVIAVDGDAVDCSNLNRTALYGPADIGVSKVIAASRELTALFPDQTFIGHEEWIDSAQSVARFASDVDFVISAADTPHRWIRMWVREGARISGVPVVETMGGAIGPIRGHGATPYDRGVAVDSSGAVRVPSQNLNGVARGPGVPPFHPMVDAAGICQAVFETLSRSRESPLAHGYVKKGSLVSLGSFHAMDA
ncbi:MAG: ThiF family adenylyltransferase [Microbacterium sp.]|nr:ThiF family adenylyltransferase [Microbacterium sp.]